MLTRMRIWLPDDPGVLGAVAAEIGAVHGNVTQRTIPSRSQENEKQKKAKQKIGNAEPPPNAVITTRFRRIGRSGRCLECVTHLCLIIILPGGLNCESRKCGERQVYCFP